MRIVGILSHANGDGRTTLAANLAVRATIQGIPDVVAVDADPGGDLAAWGNRRGDKAPTVVAACNGALSKALDDCRSGGAGIALVDLPASGLMPMEDLVAPCDFFAIPVRPHADSIEGAGKAVDLVERQGKPFVFIVNAGSQDDDETSQCIMALAQHGTLATVIVPKDDAFPTAMAAGQSVAEDESDDRSGPEIARLWHYLDGRMAKVLKDAPAPGSAVPVDNRRRFPRWSLAQPITVTWADAEWDGTLVDVSAGGAAIDCPILANPGERLSLRLDHVGTLAAEVRHVTGTRIGVRFLAPSNETWRVVKHFTELLQVGKG